MAVAWLSPPFPQDFLAEGCDGDMSEGVIETRMAAGPVKRRLKETGGWERFKGSLILTRDQYAQWKTFFLTTCKRGTIAFDWTDPISRASREFRFSGGRYSYAIVPEAPWLIKVGFEVEAQL